MHSVTTSLAGLALLLAAHGGRASDVDDLEHLLATPVYAASKYTQSVLEAPATVTVLTQGDIRGFGWRTLGEVLAGVRGVFVRYDRAYTYLGVRGLSRPGQSGGSDVDWNDLSQPRRNRRRRISFS